MIWGGGSEAKGGRMLNRIKKKQRSSGRSPRVVLRYSSCWRYDDRLDPGWLRL